LRIYFSQSATRESAADASRKNLNDSKEINMKKLGMVMCSVLFAIGTALPISAWADGGEGPCKLNKVHSKAEQAQMNRLILSLFSALKPAPEGYTRHHVHGSEIYSDSKLAYCGDPGNPPPEFTARASYSTRSQYKDWGDKNFQVAVFINRSVHTKSETIRGNTITLGLGAPGEAQRPVTKAKGITVVIEAKQRGAFAAIPADMAEVMKSVVDRGILENIIAGNLASLEEIQAVIARNSAADTDGKLSGSQTEKKAQIDNKVREGAKGSEADSTTVAKETNGTPPKSESKTTELTNATKSLRSLLGR
jgi:hypothetical protein